MSDQPMGMQGLFTPEQIVELEKLKRELEALQHAMQNLEGKSSDEVEGRLRQLSEKEIEIKKFLGTLGITTGME
uniref:Uncharacterized protein n=1 Tax=Magnetococcus massalia (strain MO-1) TaxID=451514 RepID=A0A1S7LDK1_MAGMO|nr:conserved protein of unknown function [Candidatus Magnetococcus massalia]